MSEYRDTVTDEPYEPEDLEIQVLSSAAGYYVGQLEPCGAPFSRLSGYYKTRELAETALSEGWPERSGIECGPLNDELEKAGKIERSPIH